MAWWQLDADRQSDLTAISAWHAIASALGRTPMDARVDVDRLAEGFSAFVDADGRNELALGKFGIRVTRLMAAPAAVQARAEDDRLHVERVWMPLRESLARLAPHALRNLRPPALAIDLEEVERRFVLRLPDDFVAWLSFHDGEANGSGAFEWPLHPASERPRIIESNNHYLLL